MINQKQTRIPPTVPAAELHRQKLLDVIAEAGPDGSKSRSDAIDALYAHDVFDAVKCNPGSIFGKIMPRYSRQEVKRTLGNLISAERVRAWPMGDIEWNTRFYVLPDVQPGDGTGAPGRMKITKVGRVVDGIPIGWSFEGPGVAIDSVLKLVGGWSVEELSAIASTNPSPATPVEKLAWKILTERWPAPHYKHAALAIQEYVDRAIADAVRPWFDADVASNKQINQLQSRIAEQRGGPVDAAKRPEQFNDATCAQIFAVQLSQIEEAQGRATAAEVRCRALEEQLTTVKEERDLAIAHDRQSYPTVDAYERACAALRRSGSRCETLEKACVVALDSLQADVCALWDQRLQDSSWDGVREANRVARAVCKEALAGTSKPAEQVTGKTQAELDEGYRVFQAGLKADWGNIQGVLL